MTDLRLLENREKAFLDWCDWSLRNKDCDPALWLLSYLFERFEHNIEQRFWISWIYGTTYNLPTAWIIWNEFPDFHLVDLDRLTRWNDANYKRLRYQTDTKWNKGFLPDQFASYRSWVYYDNPDKSQRWKFNSLQGKSFNFVWESISRNLYKFGRYSTWFYLQTLKDCVGMKFFPDNLKLSDYSGSRSHRNGLCYAVGRDDWVNKKLDETCCMYLEESALNLKNKLDRDMDLYQMETLLCSFKKVFRKKDGRYLGYYLDRQAEEIKRVEKDGWNGIDWSVFWDARKETLATPLSESTSIRKNLYSVFLETGTLEYGTL